MIVAARFLLALKSNDSFLPLKKAEPENNSQISDDELFADANMSNRRDSYGSESKSGSTVLDLENQIEIRKLTMFHPAKICFHRLHRF